VIPFPDTELPELTQLVAELKAKAGIRSASMDPGDLTTPAVWVRFLGLDYSLSDLALNLQLVLVVGDSDGGIRAARGLAVLHNRVQEVLDASELVVTLSGDPTASTIVLADTPTALPGLVVPIQLST
jgi:hypothetical protein